MGTNEQTTLDIMEMLQQVLAEASSIVEMLPKELLPRDIEQSLASHLTFLLMTLRERGVVPMVEKDQMTVQSEIEVVCESINDVLRRLGEDGSQRYLLGGKHRKELIRVMVEQSEIYPLIRKGSVEIGQIEQWIGRLTYEE